MTNEEINIAIAKACGLKVVSDSISHNLTPCVLDTGKFDPEGKGLTFIPNYCSNLNAMHEAEKALLQNDALLWHKYATYLDENYINQPYTIGLTAQQRAEALLKTIGLWK